MNRRAVLLGALVLAGCRGQLTAAPPRHLIDDMDWQPKLRPQGTSPHFSDGRAMRTPPADTVARGALGEDDALERGRDPKGEFLARLPVPADARLAARGHERFDIYCAPCHDRAGSGRGAVVVRGFPPPVDLASARVLGLADGQLFDTITHGVRNMPSYAAQIPVHDRWAIVLWVRVLQRARHATLADVPAAERARLGPAEVSP